jgi:hypothetical protein
MVGRVELNVSSRHRCQLRYFGNSFFVVVPPGIFQGIAPIQEQRRFPGVRGPLGQFLV